MYQKVKLKYNIFYCMRISNIKQIDIYFTKLKMYNENLKYEIKNITKPTEI